MLKIGEFSKLSHLTIKALRFYEKRGLLIALFGDNAEKEHSSSLVKARYTDQIGKFYERGGGG